MYIISKRICLGLLLMLFVSGCAGNFMQLSEIQMVKPVKDKAEVIFIMAKNGPMTGMVATLIDVNAGSLKPISTITVGKNVRYLTDPGDKIFTVITYTFGHSGFVRAHLKAGKTYYIVAHPFPTFMNDGVKLHPVKKVKTPGVKFFKSHERIVKALNNPFVEFNAKSKNAATKNMKKFKKQYNRYWAKWNGSKDDTKAMTLQSGDGF